MNKGNLAGDYWAAVEQELIDTIAEIGDLSFSEESEDQLSSLLMHSARALACLRAAALVGDLRRVQAPEGAVTQ